jgi:hypothetical protein
MRVFKENGLTSFNTRMKVNPYNANDMAKTRILAKHLL